MTDEPAARPAPTRGRPPAAPAAPAPWPGRHDPRLRPAGAVRCARAGPSRAVGSCARRSAQPVPVPVPPPPGPLPPPGPAAPAASPEFRRAAAGPVVLPLPRRPAAPSPTVVRLGAAGPPSPPSARRARLARPSGPPPSCRPRPGPPPYRRPALGRPVAAVAPSRRGIPRPSVRRRGWGFAPLDLNDAVRPPRGAGRPRSPAGRSARAARPGSTTPAAALLQRAIPVPAAAARCTLHAPGAAARRAGSIPCRSHPGLHRGRLAAPARSPPLARLLRPDARSRPPLRRAVPATSEGPVRRPSARPPAPAPDPPAARSPAG